MKKLISTFFAILIINSQLAIAVDLSFNLEDAADIVGSISSESKNNNGKKIKDPLARLEEKATNKIDSVMSKVENKIDNATSKIEQRIEKYEEKFNKYEKKIEKLEKVTDDVIDTFNSFDSKKIDKMINIAKYIGIFIGVFFTLMIILLILVFVQLTRVNRKLPLQK